MATVQITCPNCFGLGLVKFPTEIQCAQCTGVGLITTSDQNTLFTLNATQVAGGYNPIITTIVERENNLAEDQVVEIEGQQ